MKSTPPSAAVICFSPLHRDGRVQRQIRALTTICRVTAMGWSDPCIDGVRFVSIPYHPRTIPERISKAGERLLRACLLKAGCFDTAYRLYGPARHAARRLKNHKFAIIIANDINTLPLALAYRGGAKILYDAHEYSPRQYEQRFLWNFFYRRYIAHLCRTRLPQVDAMTTVGPIFAQEYELEFGVRPSVVLNTPAYRAIPYEPRKDDIIRMVHHGGASRPRRLDVLIETMKYLDDRFRLDFMLVPSDLRYISELKARASDDRRIAFVPPVKPNEIVEMLSRYDVGLCAYASHSYSIANTLPNKLFESIQARLCVVIAHAPGMNRMVEDYRCGVIATDYEPTALADVINSLDRERVEVMRHASHAAAPDLCFERSEETLLDIVRCLLAEKEEKLASSSASAAGLASTGAGST